MIKFRVFLYVLAIGFTWLCGFRLGIDAERKSSPCKFTEPADPHFSPQSWNHSRIEIEFVTLPMECPKGRNCL